MERVLEGIELTVTWPVGPTLHPDIRVSGDFGGPFDDIDIDFDLGLAYAWLDRGEPGEPSAADLLLEEQIAAIVLLREHWGHILADTRTHYPRYVQPYVVWHVVRITDRIDGGVTYVKLSGHCSAPFDTPYDEHGPVLWL